MRITNAMIMNNSRTNINANKLAVDKAQNVMASGKKIQVPSEDPITAIRALKLRNNLNELNQYYEKNVKDAQSWMKVTEDALVGIRSAVRTMYDNYVDGANGEKNVKDRATIKDAILAQREEIMKLCNTKYVGRNVFTGFKTSTDFCFTSDNDKASYDITQTFSGKDIESYAYVSGIKDFDRTNVSAILDSDMPQYNEVYKFSLGYQNLGANLTYVDKNGNTQKDGFTYIDKNGDMQVVAVNNVALTNADGSRNDAAYTTIAPPAMANYIAETGELIISKDLYNELANLKPDADGKNPITISYEKTGFKENEARPEMYYNCVDKTNPNDLIEYTREDQVIEYTVNFGQKMQVNTQIADVVGRDLIRNIDDLINSLQDVDQAEAKVAEIEKMVDSGKYDSYSSPSLEALQSNLESAEKELVLQKDILQKIMNRGVGQTQGYEESVTVAMTDIGNRGSRLKLIEERLSDQQTNFEDLESENENVEESDALLGLTQAKLAYESALTATSQISQISLLNYL